MDDVSLVAAVLTLSTPPIYKQKHCTNIKRLVLKPPYKISLLMERMDTFTCVRGWLS